MYGTGFLSIRRGQRRPLLRSLLTYDLKGASRGQKDEQVPGLAVGACLACVRGGEVVVARQCQCGHSGTVAADERRGSGKGHVIVGHCEDSGLYSE